MARVIQDVPYIKNDDFARKNRLECHCEANSNNSSEFVKVQTSPTFTACYRVTRARACVIRARHGVDNFGGAGW